MNSSNKTSADGDGSSDSSGGVNEIVAVLHDAGVELKVGKSGKIRAARIAAEVVFTDAMWQALLKQEYLVRLDADSASMTDEHVAALTQLPRLAQLDLSYTQISDACADAFLSMPKLQILHLTGTKISKETLSRLRKNMLATRIVFL